MLIELKASYMDEILMIIFYIFVFNATPFTQYYMRITSQYCSELNIMSSAAYLISNIEHLAIPTRLPCNITSYPRISRPAYPMLSEIISCEGVYQWGATVFPIYRCVCGFSSALPFSPSCNGLGVLP